MTRFSVLLILFFVLLGCSSQQEAPAPSSPEAKATRTEPQVVVPEKVKSDWSAVKLQVRDLEEDSQVVYTVPIGGSFVIPGSDLKVEVDTFLPNFIISGDKITSRGNGTANPAVQVRISAQAEQLFEGWLFAYYPRAQSFVHPRYALSLNGFVAARQKAEKPAKKG